MTFQSHGSRWRRLAVVLVLTGLFGAALAGCTPKPTAGLGAVAVAVSVPQGRSLDYAIATVRLTLTKAGQTKSVEAAPSGGVALLSVDAVPVGEWQARVEAIDSGGFVSHCGSSAVQVTNGLTEHVSVSLQERSAGVALTVHTSALTTPAGAPSRVSLMADSSSFGLNSVAGSDLWTLALEPLDPSYYYSGIAPGTHSLKIVVYGPDQATVVWSKMLDDTPFHPGRTVSLGSFTPAASVPETGTVQVSGVVWDKCAPISDLAASVSSHQIHFTYTGPASGNVEILGRIHAKTMMGQIAYASASAGSVYVSIPADWLGENAEFVAIVRPWDSQSPSGWSNMVSLPIPAS